MAKKSDSTNGNGAQEANGDSDRIQYVSLSQETRRRYLNYAMSVITSRALPDVRDGLKPVQRRILYVMYDGLRLTPDAKRRKSMKVCGDTTGNFHPHGDGAVYEALVRLAQDFTLRYPLVDGQGNFGSVLGLAHAAARYTEVRLTAIATELMSELGYETVDTRPNYEGSDEEPVVLPARLPHLLINGIAGIAVGMATNIPPHNLNEIVKAATTLIQKPDTSTAQLLRTVKGPDFPLGGRVVTDRQTIRECYETGRGSIKVRGEWKFDDSEGKPSKNRLVIYSVPYGVSTNPLMESLGGICEGRKLPQLVSITDETNEENGLRIVLELKTGSNPESVMEYLYKHTPLEQNFAYNLTALAPDETGVGVPRRMGLKEMLQHFLDFRLETVRKRFQYELDQLERRIHILEGFALIFEGLDRALRIIRNSQGKRDAAEKLMAEFPLDEVQTNAILEMMLYKISQLEIDNIIEELREKQAAADEIRKILASETKLWKVVEDELEEIRNQYGDERRTTIGSVDDIAEYDPEAYILKENTNVVLTREGWIKRVGRLSSVKSTRVREGDEVLAVCPGSTVDSVVVFSNDGVAYTLRIDQIPVSSGYGEPLSKHVRLGDGVELVAAMSTDSRFTPEDDAESEEQTSPPYFLIVTEMGQVMRLSLSGFREPSTKNGRKFCRLRSGDRVVHVELVRHQESIFIASAASRILHFGVEEIPILAGPGKGVIGIKLDKSDKVLGALLIGRPSDSLKVVNTNGTPLTFGQMKYQMTSRGGRGVRTSQRNNFAEIVRPDIELVDWSDLES